MKEMLEAVGHYQYMTNLKIGYKNALVVVDKSTFYTEMYLWDNVITVESLTLSVNNNNNKKNCQSH